MGFSMRGLQLVNYLKTHPAGFGISLHKFIYNLAITKNFQKNLQWNLDTYKQARDIDIENALKCNDIKTLDDLVTRSLLKYDNIDQMYSQIKCTNNLYKRKCPLLLISSKNDPIIDQDIMPKSEILQNENIILVQTQKEGIQNGFKEQGILKEYKQYIQQWVNKPSVCFLDYIDKIIIMLKYLKYSRYLFCTSKTPPQAETRRYFTRSERLDDFQHTQSHLLDMMAKHFRKKIVERQLIDFKYIVGRPNTLFVPVSVEENFPNPSLNRGTVLRQHLDGVWIHCYNSTYPVHIQQEIHYIPNIKDQFITIDPDAETDFLEGADAESFKIKRDIFEKDQEQ
ncbi:hypothetical protein pb186bvf_021160, partial [Paramecium bursaria]